MTCQRSQCRLGFAVTGPRHDPLSPVNDHQSWRHAGDRHLPEFTRFSLFDFALSLIDTVPGRQLDCVACSSLCDSRRRRPFKPRGWTWCWWAPCFSLKGFDRRSQLRAELDRAALANDFTRRSFYRPSRADEVPSPSFAGAALRGRRSVRRQTPPFDAQQQRLRSPRRADARAPAPPSVLKPLAAWPRPLTAVPPAIRVDAGRSARWTPCYLDRRMAGSIGDSVPCSSRATTFLTAGRPPRRQHDRLTDPTSTQCIGRAAPNRSGAFTRPVPLAIPAGCVPRTADQRGHGSTPSLFGEEGPDVTLDLNRVPRGNAPAPTGA